LQLTFQARLVVAYIVEGPAHRLQLLPIALARRAPIVFGHSLEFVQGLLLSSPRPLGIPGSQRLLLLLPVPHGALRGHGSPPAGRPLGAGRLLEPAGQCLGLATQLILLALKPLHLPAPVLTRHAIPALVGKVLLAPGELSQLLQGLVRLPTSTSLRRSEEHTSELQSRENLVCRLLLEKKKKTKTQL